ncbi:MAG: tetratricopeptide repeat protein [Acidobacteriota bacterium]|nr:tetratricopeptide repeat protein [Acidobacteriota bacterium]
MTTVRHAPLLLSILGALAAVSLFGQSTSVEQGRAAIGRGDSDAAIEILEKAVAQSPKSAEAHYYLGSAYGSKVQSSGMLAGAKYASRITEEFEKAVALDPRYVEAHFGLVQVYANAPGIMGGSYDKAFEHAKAIKAIDPIVGHRAYASIYSQQKKLDLAAKEYIDAIREEPGSPKAHAYFGQYHANVEKDFAAAFAELEAALKLDPSYMPAWYHLGRTASLANTNVARGEEALKKYVAYTPKENEPTLANAHYFLADIYEKQGRKSEAKQAYQAALKLNPTLTKAADALKRVS